jgi:hypothetical protein
MQPSPVLSAAYGDHDFKPVPVDKEWLIESASRDNFTVALDRNTLPLQSHLLQQLSNGHWGMAHCRAAWTLSTLIVPSRVAGKRKASRFSVDDELCH